MKTNNSSSPRLTEEPINRKREIVHTKKISNVGESPTLDTNSQVEKDNKLSQKEGEKE